MAFTEKQMKQIDRAAEVLQADEQVFDVTTGAIEVTRMGEKTTRNGAVLVTDRRVILYTKKLGGYEMNDHVYGLLTALDYKKGMMFGSVTLSAAGDRTHVSQIPKEDVERIAKAIRERMASTVQAGGPTAAPAAPAASAADEIRKLAELRDVGVLTEDEFNIKKQQLLGL
jgi:hypothetical protein